MNIEIRNIDDLRPNPENVRNHNSKQVKELAKAIKKYDVIRPIVIDENNMILCGHGLYEALRVNGCGTAECIVKSNLSNTEKKKLMLADNKIYDIGTNNFGAIDKILSELGVSGDFDVPGYDSDMLEEMYGVASIEADAKEEISRSIIPDDKAEQTPSQERDQYEEEQELGEEEPDEPVPSPKTQEARQQAIENRKTMICPHCGGIIEL